MNTKQGEEILQECECCHDEFSVRDIQLQDGAFMCPGCRSEGPRKTSRCEVEEKK